MKQSLIILAVLLGGCASDPNRPPLTLDDILMPMAAGWQMRGPQPAYVPPPPPRSMNCTSRSAGGEVRTTCY